MIQRLIVALSLLSLAAAAVPDTGAAQHFGRNKVQYRSFDFRVIKTDHFDVYFYPQEKQAAIDAARMVERAYARLSRILRHEFKERKPIILYASHGEFQQTNAIRSFISEGTGGVTEALKNRIIMPFTGSYAHFERVLIHELVHAFQYDVIFQGGSMSSAQSSQRRLPLWFMEGMAEYLALGELDAITAAWLRDASFSGYLRSIGEMNQRDDYLSYRFGQSLWTYIGSTWGDEVVGVLLQKAPRIGLQRAFRTTLGVSLEELSREWQSAVRKTYLPQVTEFERPDAVAEAVVQHESLRDNSYLAPAISPDGEEMALFTTRDGFFPDLWLADAHTGEIKERLVRSNREASFESLRYQNSSAAYSADGRYLAFTAQTEGRDALYIYDLEEDEITRKLELDLNGVMTPTWSPDGRRIAFSGIDGGISDLYVVEVADGTVRRLTNDRHSDLFPSWSPDGEAIAFSTDRGRSTDFDQLVFSNLQVALLHVDDGTVEVLPHQERGRNLNPVWSPDSRSLTWVSDRTGIKNLYLYERDERQLYRITDLLSGVMGPTATDRSPTLAWARDSGRLLFVYFEAAGHSIYAIDDPRTLPRTPVEALDARADRLALATDSEESEDAGAANPTESITVDSVEVDETVVSSYYRRGGDFRPSALLPDSARAAPPISVVAMLDSADMALPDTAAFAIEDYDVKLTADMIGRPTIGAQAGGYYGNGVYGGSYIALSDMLGNHSLVLAGNINGSFSDAMFFGGYNFLKHRANYGAALQQVPMYRYLGRSGPYDLNGDQVVADLFTRDVIRRAQARISYPFSSYRRVELGASGTFVNRDLIHRGVNLSQGGAPLQESTDLSSVKFFKPSTALVFDNTLFGWTGPIVGRRYRLEASRTVGDFSFWEGLIDFRNYFNYNQSIVFASRLLSLIRMGDNADQFMMYWGGPYFLRGYDANSFDLNSSECRDYPGGEFSSCPMRRQLVGSSAAILNLELRFPIITELQVGGIGNFPPVDAVVFFDGGMAWDNELCLERSRADSFQCGGRTEDVGLVWDRKSGSNPVLVREPLFSTGVGLRLNVFYTVLRIDYAVPLNRPVRDGVWSFSFGPSF